MKTNLELRNLLAEGTVYRYPVKPRDKPVLKSDIYNIVDIAYDDEGKYVPHCFICQKCSLIMCVLQEGGHSKLRMHHCVKSYLKRDVDEDDDGENSEYFYNQIRIDSKYSQILRKAFKKLTKIEMDRLNDIFPKDWSQNNW